jgi:hypothetical protein
MRVSAFLLGKFLQLAAFVLAGFVLGLVISKAADSGYFQQWQKLPVSSAKITELPSANGNSVFAKTDSGEVLRCTEWNYECWVKDKIPERVSWSGEVTKPCNYSSPEFVLLANPPGTRIDCVQSNDGFTRYAYVLDDSGNTWQWAFGESIDNRMGRMVIYPALGALVGLILGVIWLRRRPVNK